MTALIELLYSKKMKTTAQKELAENFQKSHTELLESIDRLRGTSQAETIYRGMHDGDK
jgi:phage regulator Rha-like protein